NPKTTDTNYNMVQESLPLDIQEETVVPKKKKERPTFIPYNNQQGICILDLQEFIPTNHVSRVVDEMMERIEDDLFFQHYKGGGRSSYHPKMMVKIILYAYSQKVYSCREIAKLLNENIPAMWLAAMQKPDYRTINRFRTTYMSELIQPLFEKMIHQLIKQKYITMENYFLDGTKIEANANKYSFVWKKTTTSFEEKLKEKIDNTYQYIQSIAIKEDRTIVSEDQQSSLTLKEKLDQAEEILTFHIDKQTKTYQEETEPGVRKEKRKKLTESKKLKKQITEDFRPRLEKYEYQQQVFGDRNSYSKIDTDATFMRMKEDPMKNGQLKPGYNVQ
ncbi:transposase, partial [Microbacteriaceae bacterium 4G12]